MGSVLELNAEPQVPVMGPEDRACVASELSALAEQVEEAASRLPRSSPWRSALLGISTHMRESADENGGA